MTTNRRIAIILLLIGTISSQAQMNLQQNAVVAIADNTQLTLSADMISYGSIINHGTLNVHNQWTNYGLYESNGDTVRFVGGQQQVVNHNGGSFDVVMMDGAGILLESDARITGLLILDRGYIRPETNVQLVLAENALVENASEASHVKGRLIAEGTGDKFYPIGCESFYMPAWLHSSDGNNSIAGLEVMEPNPVSEVSRGISRVFPEAYWQLSMADGDMQDTRISLSYNHFATVNPQMLVVAELSETGNVFQSIGNGNLDADQSMVTSRDAITGSLFTLAEIDGLITISNVISPNGDNVNDYLYIANIEEFPENEILIFNRAGLQIYRDQHYNNTWNGTVDDNPLPAGSYFCVVKLSDLSLSYSQTITIVR
jgi:gliding motility-associated-like protein